MLIVVGTDCQKLGSMAMGDHHDPVRSRPSTHDQVDQLVRLGGKS